MRTYDTLSQAIEDLKGKGYQYDFELRENEIYSKEKGKSFVPEDFKVTDVYRFEGQSSAGDNSVLYVVEAKNDLKGMIVDAYGTYSGQTLSREMIKRLAVG